MPLVFKFDPNASPAAIEARVQELLDEFADVGGHRIVERRDPRGRFEQKEDKPKQNEPVIGSGDGSQGGSQFQVLFAGGLQTTQEPVVGNDTQEILVALNQPANQPVTVFFEFRNGTATNGVDFIAPTGIQSVTFNPGQTLKSILYQIKSDALTEGTEKFVIKFTTSPNAQLGSGFPPSGEVEVTVSDP